MATCTRCGAGAWHPCVFFCSLDNCELRGLTTRASADALSPLGASADLPVVVGGRTLSPAADMQDNRSRDSETYSFGSEMQVGGVHAHGGTL